MKKNLIRLIIAATTVSTLGVTSAFADVQDSTEGADNSVQATTPAEVTTTTPAEVQVSDIPEEIQQKYSDYFTDNQDVNSIEDIISKLYKSLDSIDVQDNPNFSTLKDGEIPYNILCDIDDNYQQSLDEETLSDIEHATMRYSIYSELSKDGGYIFQGHSNSEDSTLRDSVKNFLVNYNYNNATEQSFKEGIESYLDAAFGKNFTLDYNVYDDTTFKLPTIDNTGYVYISADIHTEDNSISLSFSYETVLQKIKSSSSGSGSSSSHHSSGGGGSSSSSSNDITNTTDENNNSQNSTSGTNSNTDTSANNMSVDPNTKILKDSNGNALTGWQKDINGNWYLANSTGEVQTGWYQDTSGSWYLFKDNGVMSTGWQKVNGTWYYLQQEGAMKRGWYQDTNGSWYLLKEDGSMVTGWYENTDGNWYYLQSDGSMAHDATINGYTLNSNGAWIE